MRTSGKLALVIIVSVLLALVAGGAILAPRLVERMVHSRVTSLAERLDVSITYDSVVVSFLRGVAVSRLSVSDSREGLLVSVGAITARIAWGRLLSNRFPLERASLEALTVHPHPRLAGVTATVSRITLHERVDLRITDLAVSRDSGAAGHRLIALEHAGATIAGLDRTDDGLSVSELTVEGVSVVAVRDTDGVTDIGRLVGSTIEVLLDVIALARGSAPVGDARDDSDAEPTVGSATRTMGDLFPGQLNLARVHVSLTDRFTPRVNGAADVVGLDVDELFVAMDRVDGVAHIRSSGGLRADGAPAGRWLVDQHFWYREGGFEGTVTAGEIDLGVLARLVGKRPATVVRSGVIDLDVTTGRRLTGESRFAGELRLRRMVLHLPTVASGPVVFPRLGYRFVAHLDSDAELAAPRLIRPLAAAEPGPVLPVLAVPAVPSVPSPDKRPAGVQPSRGVLVFDEGTATVGAMVMEILPTVRGFAGRLRGFSAREADNQLPARVELRVNLPSTPIQILVDAIPAVLLGELSGIRVDGTVAWNLDLEVPMDELARMQWRTESILEDFSVAEIPPGIDVFRLAGPFVHRIVDSAVEFDRTILVPSSRPLPSNWLSENAGLSPEQIDHHRSTRTHRDSNRTVHRFSTHERPDPGYRFVPLASISPWVVRAILTGEDGDFFHHTGVNWNSVRRAIDRNVSEGGFVVGASTISMQLAKNLFLSGDRLVARKLQEVILVFLMEHAASISKERILEIYLNVIEFGPGIYGIHDAARYYFNKTPAELSLTDSVWLASIVPNPKRFHYYYRIGGVSDGWFVRMRQYYDTMLLRSRITEEQHRAATEQRPLFYRPD